MSELKAPYTRKVGRPKVYKNPIDFTIRLDRETVDRVMIRYPKKTRSRAIALFIESALEIDNPVAETR